MYVHASHPGWLGWQNQVQEHLALCWTIITYFLGMFHLSNQMHFKTEQSLILQKRFFFPYVNKKKKIIIENHLPGQHYFIGC